MGAHVYIMTNQTRGTLYTGVTTDLVSRVAAHREGRGSQFTTKYRCTRLVWFAEFDDISMAIAHEKRVKKWRRRYKIEELEKMNPDWRDLWDDLIGL